MTMSPTQQYAGPGSKVAGKSNTHVVVEGRRRGRRADRVSVDASALKRAVEERIGDPDKRNNASNEAFGTPSPLAGLQTIADMAGVTSRRINRLMSGDTLRTDIYALDAIPAALGVHVSRLLLEEAS